MGDPPAWGLGGWLRTPTVINMLINVIQGLGLGRVPWNDIINEKCFGDLEFRMSGVSKGQVL
jgi:hypothetical protein